ncbi:hypothetical protein LTR10_009337 [Elasticomyces elasticus]|nr:hypothetical protein LTR10_009337 [Elasticomyces elasticus]KAK4971563.1 hypothetical protein LTR42_007291 [Elasticomyces elasticus]
MQFAVLPEKKPPSTEQTALLEKDDTGYGTAKARSPCRLTNRALPLGERWMAKLHNRMPVSALTIPGTHDSAAFTGAWPFIQTQKMGITEQLNAGIRYFDLRCGLRDDIVEMVHGSAILGLTLSVLLDMVYLWMMSHPTEALVVQIKQDRAAERSSMHFAHAIWSCISSGNTHWRTANTTPTLGELRGRIQLLRRFTGPTLHAYGIDVTQWQDNPSKPFTIYTWHDVQVTIQDHYRPAEAQALPALIARKGGDVVELLEHAAANIDSGHWYINFTSAYEFNLWYQLPPREIAVGGYWAFKWEEGINPRLSGYLQQHKGQRRYGIVPMDFPESGADDLITALIESNYKHVPSNASWVWRTLLVVVFILAATAAFVYATCDRRTAACMLSGGHFNKSWRCTKD